MGFRKRELVVLSLIIPPLTTLASSSTATTNTASTLPNGAPIPPPPRKQPPINSNDIRPPPPKNPPKKGLLSSPEVNESTSNDGAPHTNVKATNHIIEGKGDESRSESVDTGKIDNDDMASYFPPARKLPLDPSGKNESPVEKETKADTSEKPLKPILTRPDPPERRPPPPRPDAPLHAHPLHPEQQSRVLAPPNRRFENRPPAQWLDATPPNIIDGKNQRPLVPPQRPPQHPPPQFSQGHAARPATRIYRGPPPNMQNPSQNTGQLIPHRQPQRTRQPPAWRRVWKGIERGLDSLADLEESVTERATKLASDVRIPKIPTTLVDNLWKNQNPLPNRPTNIPSQAQPPHRHEKLVQEGIEGLMERKMKASRFTVNPKPSQQKEESHTKGSSTKISPFSKLTDKGWKQETKRVMQATGGAAVGEGSEPRVAVFESRKPLESFSGPSQPSNPSSTEPRRPIVANKIGRDGGAPSSQAPSPQQKPPIQFDDDDDDSSRGLRRFLPRLPAFRLGFPRRLSSREYISAADMWADDDEEEEEQRKGGFFHRWSRRTTSTKVSVSAISPNLSGLSRKVRSSTPPIDNLLGRSDDGDSATLLTTADRGKCVSVGRAMALADFVRLLLIVAAVRMLPGLEPILTSPHLMESILNAVPSLVESSLDALQTWSPFAFCAAILLWLTSNLIYGERLERIAESTSTDVQGEVDYGAMFLSVYSSEVTSANLRPVAGKAAREQALAEGQTARFRFFVGCLIVSLVATTSKFLQPLAALFAGFVKEVIGADVLRQRPLEPGLIMSHAFAALSDVGTSLMTLLQDDLTAAMENPLAVAYRVSVFLALCMVAILPSIETKRKVHQVGLLDEEEAEARSHTKLTGHLLDLASSGANRLGLVSVDHSIEILLERWRRGLVAVPSVAVTMTTRSLGRLVVYGLLAGAVLIAPLLVYGSAGIFSPNGVALNPFLRWDSILDVTIALYFTHRIALHALSHVVLSQDMKQYIKGFVDKLKAAHEERKKVQGGGSPDLQLQASISPSAGIVVKDLWAAHTTKRAWAVRGAGLSCKNGEVLLVLGDSGSGKTRLLTTLAEAVLGPPKSSLSATRVRGSVVVGGVEVSKWDRSLLRKRLGLLLNDVRMVSDSANLASGLTLEEVLEPSDGVQVLDPSHSPGPNERSCILLALKITGLYSTLLTKLPSKMSSVLTSREDDLKPSPLRPRYNVLSPTEWSKITLAKVLAQAIYDNENSAGTNDAIENSLMGSVLLLDDALVHLSEVDETRFIRELRKTGAAAVLTSNRWAAGRFVDRIVVVKDGTVVETGTHEELLSRGPQQSLYAAQWHSMTTN